MGIGKIGLQFQRPSICGNRVIRFAIGSQYIPEVI